jgi:hypothetical protein
MKKQRITDYLPVDSFELIDGKLHQKYIFIYQNCKGEIKIIYEYVQVEEFFSINEKLILGIEIQMN